VGVENGSLIVDLGPNKGLRVGQAVELWRQVRLRHPVTHRWVADRFRSGTLVIQEIGTSLCLARPVAPLKRPAKVGDVVLFVPESVSPSHAVEGSASAVSPAHDSPTHDVSSHSTADCSRPCPRTDPEAEEVCRLFTSLRGASPARRIVAYENYVARHPGGKYSAVLYEEARALRAGLRGKKVSPRAIGLTKRRAREILARRRKRR
jgi:hypothetical protein